MKRTVSFIFTLLLCLCAGIVSAQKKVTISGKVTDELTKEPLISASVVLKGTAIGGVTDLDGIFKFEINDTPSVTLVITYIGYEEREVKLSSPFPFTEIKTKNFAIQGEQVVVTGSRVAESIMESGITIDKLDARDIKTAPSGNFYQGLSTLADIDVISSSAGFNVVNMRGFNTTQPERSVQYIDGIDNQAPGLNFAVGNLMGANDLDLSSVEIIHGAASALYGANALQGVISMTTKDPFNFPGLGVQLKGGSRNYFDVQGRYARSFGKKDQFGFKVVGAFMRIDDWPADDSIANTYGDIEPEVNMTGIIAQKQYQEVDEEFTQEDLDDAIALNNWLGFNPEAYPGIQTVKAPGYLEPYVADYDSRMWRISPTLYWKFKPGHEVSYLFKYGRGTAVYQGTNRYSIKDITYQQHKLEFSGKNYLARVYTTLEDAGESYDNVFTAINISKEGVAEYVSQYLTKYFDTIDTLTAIKDESFCADCLERWMVDSARHAALIDAADAWYEPGSKQFDSLFQEITHDPNLQTGSLFLDQSKLVHAEGQYRFDEYVKWLELLVGTSYRAYLPKSYGTIFSDTLINPADTLDNGRDNPDGEYEKIVTHEFGIYGTATKRLLEDKLRLSVSLRMDKYTSFDPQVSPRGSIVFTHKNHTLRVSAQSAYRLPTLQDQYILLDLGPITLVGNLDGYPAAYTLKSVDEFNDSLDVNEIDPDLLETVNIPKLRPEKVKTIEFGYRTVHAERLYIDFGFYFNWYKDFIGDMRVAAIQTDGVVGEESGVDAVITKNYDLYQIPINSDKTVRTWGYSVGLSYYWGHGLTLKGNYTYSDINENDIDDDLIPGYNTPMHKFNLGLEGKRVWKGLGFNSNFRWSDTYLWQSPFGDGQIPAYFTLDAQLNYEFKEYYTTISVGGSNLLNDPYRTAYGSPLIGRMFYASLIFDINKI